MIAWRERRMGDVVLWLGILALAWAILAGIFALGWWRWFRWMRDQDERDSLPPH
jgi:hypothetical protein